MFHGQFFMFHGQNFTLTILKLYLLRTILKGSKCSVLILMLSQVLKYLLKK